MGRGNRRRNVEVIFVFHKVGWRSVVKDRLTISRPHTILGGFIMEEACK